MAGRPEGGADQSPPHPPILRSSALEMMWRWISLERIWRDARVERIWEGTSEIQRHIISRALLRPLGA